MGHPAPQLTCSQCGGVLTPAEGEIFITCPYCRATVYLDKSRVVFHWAITPTVDEQAAQANLRRWMAGNQTVKNLDRKATLAEQTFQYFPLWHIKVAQAEQEIVYLEPATATSITEIKRLVIPAGDLNPYRSELDAQAVPPDVPYQAVVKHMEERGIKSHTIREAALVHMPLYTLKYIFEGRRYTAIVEAASGQVFANVFPAKWETPYLAVAAVAFIGYFLANWIVTVGYVMGNAEGMATGVALCALAYAIWTVPVFLLALLVSRKV